MGGCYLQCGKLTFGTLLRYVQCGGTLVPSAECRCKKYTSSKLTLKLIVTLYLTVTDPLDTIIYTAFEIIALQDWTRREAGSLEGRCPLATISSRA